MLLLGTGLAIPHVVAGGVRPVRRGAVRRPRGRRVRGRHGVPDDAGADRRAVVGPGSHEVDRALVGARRCDRRSRAAVSGALLEQFDWGSVFLVTFPLAVVALVLAFLFVPAHVNETTEPVDNLGGILSVVLVGALILRSTSRRCPTRERSCSVSPLIAVAALGRVRHPAAPGGEPAVRP